jgi:secondary thiamine-phosphate synthase enzyme
MRDGFGADIMGRNDTCDCRRTDVPIVNRHLEVATEDGITLHDITPSLRDLVADSGLWNGFVNVTSRHTTTALTINEFEERLLDDVRTFFARLVPPGDRYLHNDIHLRDCPPDEPKNAHSHLIAMLLGSSEVIALRDGALDLGTWQSVMLVDLDGPRRRTVSVQVYGE